MIKAVIFDMDGVISDSQKQHSLLESKLLARLGIKISPKEITRRFAGVRVKDFFSKLLADKGIEADIDALVLEKRQAIVDLVKDEGTDPIPGIFELIARLEKAKIKLAVGSASSLELVGVILGTLDLQENFPIRASGQEVTNGKPAPDIFLLASDRLGVDPEQCLVIEDGVSGMEAAKAANMKCVGLVEKKKGKYPADIIVTSLDEITIDLIKGL